MLNKELLVVGARKVYPYTHLVKVSISKLNNYKIIGYSSELMYDTSTITPIVLSISGYDCGVVELCSWQEHNHTGLELAANGAPSTIIYLGRSDIGLSYGEGSIEFWDSSDDPNLSIVKWNGMVFTDDDIDKVVPVWLSSNPPPHTNKKVKQVFTRSRKEGVVNAGEGNAYRVGYTRKGKYHQRHGLHCTGDPRWKFSLDYTSWQDRKGQRTYRGCGISIFPRLGWKLTRACHHGHIEKYITHWLYRFPSKAPNGRLIRKYLLNLGVTSQLEVPYAA